jgi:ferrous iron transport protein A
MVPLGLLSDGEVGEIVAVRLGDRSRPEVRCDSRAEDMGLRVGKRVLMLKNRDGAVLVKVDESRIAVDRGVAMRIVVEEVTE